VETQREAIYILFLDKRFARVRHKIFGCWTRPAQYLEDSFQSFKGIGYSVDWNHLVQAFVNIVIYILIR
jgi:hypothetical protein